MRLVTRLRASAYQGGAASTSLPNIVMHAVERSEKRDYLQAVAHTTLTEWFSFVWSAGHAYDSEGVVIRQPDLVSHGYDGEVIDRVGLKGLAYEDFSVDIYDDGAHLEDGERYLADVNTYQFRDDEPIDVGEAVGILCPW